jgi:hypothetical protein
MQSSENKIPFSVLTYGRFEDLINRLTKNISENFYELGIITEYNSDFSNSEKERLEQLIFAFTESSKLW